MEPAGVARKSPLTWLVVVIYSSAACSTDIPTDDVPPADAPESGDAMEGKSDLLPGFDLCSWNNRYSDGTCDLGCDEPDPDCDLFAAEIAQTGRLPTLLPILLVHGFTTSHVDVITNPWVFYQVPGALRADGHQVCLATVAPFDHSEVRGSQLMAEIERCLEETGASQVNIIAHSMGGLDARYAISVAGMAPYVASLTTISTAHRGTRIADIGLSVVPEIADAALDALSDLYGLHLSRNELAENSNLRGALTALSEEGAADFNARVVDASSVHYQSWMGVASTFGFRRMSTIEAACDDKVFIHDGGRVRTTNPILVPLAALMGPHVVHDAMVSVESAKWGNFRGCVPGDHMSIVGGYRFEGQQPDSLFNHVSFYRYIAYDLSDRGF